MTDSIQNIVMFDTEQAHFNLLPLSYTRPVAMFRSGICTIREKWELDFPGTYSFITAPFLTEKFTPHIEEDNLFIMSNLLPDPMLVQAVSNLPKGHKLLGADGELLAMRGSYEQYLDGSATTMQYKGQYVAIRQLYDIFLYNSNCIKADFQRLTHGRRSQPLSATNRIVGNPLLPDGSDAIFIEEGGTVECANLNVKEGPIYIGRDAEVMEGSCLRGPLSLGTASRINMLSKIYPGTTIGPHCKVGGEINNAVIFGYSNKAHDGYLGNAVIGEWCNIGAGVNASNLKNDYSKIRLWNYPEKSFLRTDLQFCGLMMGDHSKAGINCMFNTATVVGVGCNIHGAGFPRPFIPSFSEGSPQGGFSDVKIKKFFDIAQRAMARRGVELTDVDYRLFEAIFDMAAQYK